MYDCSTSKATLVRASMAVGEDASFVLFGFWKTESRLCLRIVAVGMATEICPNSSWDSR